MARGTQRHAVHLYHVVHLWHTARSDPLVIKGKAAVGRRCWLWHDRSTVDAGMGSKVTPRRASMARHTWRSSRHQRRGCRRPEMLAVAWQIYCGRRRTATPRRASLARRKRPLARHQRRGRRRLEMVAAVEQIYRGRRRGYHDDTTPCVYGMPHGATRSSPKRGRCRPETTATAR